MQIRVSSTAAEGEILMHLKWLLMAKTARRRITPELSLL